MPLEFGKQAVCVNELGKQAWLGLVSGSKKEENNKEWKKTKHLQIETWLLPG